MKCVVGMTQPMGQNMSRIVFEGFDEHEPGREIEGLYQDEPDARWASMASVRFRITGKHPEVTPIRIHECTRCGTIFAVEIDK